MAGAEDDPVVSIAHAYHHVVMPALVPGIHICFCLSCRKTWMAGTSPAMTVQCLLAPTSHHAPITLDAGLQHLVAGRASTSSRPRRSRPRCGRRSRPPRPCARMPRQVDDAVAHHAAVEQQVARSAPASRRCDRRGCARAGARDLRVERRDPTTRDRRRPPRRRRRRARRRDRAPARACSRRRGRRRTSDAAARSPAACRRRAHAAAIAAMPSRTCARAPAMSLGARSAGRRRPAPGSARRAPPPRRWRGGCRRSRLLRPAASAAGNMPPRQ